MSGPSSTLVRVLSAAAVLVALAAPAAARVGEMCGGIGGLRCGAGEYCRIASRFCGVADAAGACQRRPDFCTREYRPVCGCDGRTYGNPCEAAAAGASVLKPGRCGRRAAPR